MDQTWLPSTLPWITTLKLSARDTIWLRSERQGINAKIEVTGGDANAALAFPTDPVYGEDDIGWAEDWDDVDAGSALFSAETDEPDLAERFDWDIWYDSLAEAGSLELGHRSWGARCTPTTSTT